MRYDLNKKKGDGFLFPGIHRLSIVLINELHHNTH